MSHPAHTDPNPFLSVIAWPDGATRESMAQLLAGTTGLDVPTLRLRLGQAPPSIIGQVDSEAAKRAMDAIRAEGGDAFSVTLGQLASLGPAKGVRSMSIGNGILAMELRDGSTAALRFQDLWLLVQGMVRETTRESPPPVSQPRRLQTRFGRHTSSSAALSVGAAGLAMFFGEGYLNNNSSAAPTTTTVARNKLHIHDAHGVIYEVNGRGFNFNILGEMKQYNERSNMEQLCELLSHLAPDEIVDPYFPLWKPPPRYTRLRIDGETGQSDRPFAFYSRWVAMMYRHLLEKSEAAMFPDE